VVGKASKVMAIRTVLRLFLQSKQRLRTGRRSQKKAWEGKERETGLIEKDILKSQEAYAPTQLEEI